MISTQTKIRELFFEFPKTMRVFEEWGIPCFNCDFDKNETVYSLAQKKGLKESEIQFLLKQLNQITFKG